MSKVFRFQQGIPHHFALCVMFIISEKNKTKSWETLREKYAEGAPIFEWVQSILYDNDVEYPKNDIGWWKTQIQGH